MKIVLSSLPNNHWWSKGMPKYEDNPAMIKGTIPNQIILENEWNNLKNILSNFSFDLEIIPFPHSLDGNDPKNWKHDFIFVRDLFISNTKGDVVIARFRESQRTNEEQLIEKWLIQNQIKIHKLPYNKEYFMEGGEFYYCNNENILFAGLNRNNSIGNTKTAELLNVEELIQIKANAFHLDTFFTPVFNIKNELCLIIVCMDLIDNKSAIILKDFTRKRGIDLKSINPEEALGTTNKLGSFAVNCLPLPGLLLSSGPFISNSINEALTEHNISHKIIPLTQFHLSGGSVHCLTNEI